MALAVTQLVGFGGNVFSPLSIRDLSLWLEADDFTSFTTVGGTETGNIIDWNDKSSNALVFTQGTDSLRPNRVDAVVNGHWIVRGTGTEFLKDASVGTVAMQQTAHPEGVCVGVCINDAVTDRGAVCTSLFGNTDGVVLLEYTPDETTTRFFTRPTGNAIAHTLTADQFNILMIRCTDQAASLYDVEMGSNGVGNFDAADSEAEADYTVQSQGLGILAHPQPTRRELTGDVAEIVMSDTALPDGEIQIICQHFSSKYSITLEG